MLKTFQRQRKEGEVIWAIPKESGPRSYMCAPFKELLAQLQAAPEANRLFEEVYEHNRPARLFYDLDGDKLSFQDAESMVNELVRATQQTLKDTFDLDPVAHWVLDSSNTSKQSRHLFFDIGFKTLGDLRAFVAVVLNRCTQRHGKNICAVDIGKYLQPHSAVDATNNLRLYLCHKPGKAEILTVKQGRALEYEKCMVNIVGEEELWSMPGIHFSEKLAVRVENGPARLTTVVHDRVQTWLQLRAAQSRNWTGNNAANSMIVSLKGVYCPVADRVHSSNGVKFSLHVRADKQVMAHFSCMDRDCINAARHVDDDLFPLCYPDEAKAMMDACCKRVA